eukprot:6200600-Pleurochrysis_carterae.AAC.1
MHAGTTPCPRCAVRSGLRTPHTSLPAMVCQACNARTLRDAAVQTDETRLHEPSVEALRMRASRKRKKQRKESVMRAQLAVRNAQKGVAQAT